MLLNHFAFEIWHEILRFCTSSTLSSLSRVNTSLRDLAEYVLYGHIYFSTCPFDLIRDKACKSWALTEKRSLLHTLSTNTRKAAMVKALYIEFERVSSFGVERALHSILVKLSGVLQNMPNLVDLRIVYDKMTDPSKGSLSKMIRGNHFRLHTLCVEVSHDLEGIITAQPHLQLLGIYYANSDILFGNKIRPLLKTSRCHMMPTVFMLDSSAYITTLALFPSSHRPGEALQVCQEIAASLGMFPKNYYVPDRCHISFHLGGIMKEHISLLQEVMEAMAICMRKYFHCSYLGVIIYDSTIKKPWLFREFTQSLAIFKTVETITFHYHNLADDELALLSSDLRLHMVRGLGRVWSGVRRMRILDWPVLECTVLDRQSDWRPVAEILHVTLHG